MYEENKSIVRRYIDEVWSKGSLDTADEIIHPDAHPPHGFDDMPNGPEGFKGLVTMLRTTFPNLHRKINDLIAEDDKVVVYSIFTGTHTGNGGIAPFPPTYEKWEMSGVTAFRIADGKIIEEPWAVNDIAAMIQQLAKATVRRAFGEVWNEKNADAIEHLYSIDFVHHDVNGGAFRGHDGVRKLLNEFASEFPNSRFLLENMIAEADKVFAHWTVIANEDKRLSGMSLIRFADGRIAEEWEMSG